MWKNKISKKYSNKKIRLKNLFPEAYEFLTIVENLSSLHFHIGTASNLHLYYKDSFIVYIKVDPPIKFHFSPNYNERLKKDAPKNNPNMFFIPLKEEFTKQNLTPEYDVDKIRIRANNNAQNFFDCALNVLASIANIDYETLMKNQNQRNGFNNLTEIDF